MFRRYASLFASFADTEAEQIADLKATELDSAREKVARHLTRHEIHAYRFPHTARNLKSVNVIPITTDDGNFIEMISRTSVDQVYR